MEKQNLSEINLDEHYRISQYCISVINRDIAIIYHKLYGNALRVSLECWEIIQNNVNHTWTLQNICDACTDNDDKDYMIRLFKEMIKAKLLIKIEEKEIEDKISQIDLAITNCCNLECIHCCADAKKSKKEYILKEEFYRLIDAISRLHVSQITITGGEPMVCPGFLEMTEFLKNNFHGIRLLMTNATLITPKNVGILVKCYDQFNISLDGYDEESCSKIRGDGVFNQVISNIKLLIKNGVSPDRISLSMVETKMNFGEIEKFITLNQQLGTNPMIREFEAIGRGEKNAKLLRPDAEKDIGYIDLSRPLMVRTCAAGERRFAINSFGDIIPCMLLDMSRFKMGNIYEIEDLYKFFNEREFKETDGYKKLLRIKPETRQECSGCKFQMFCCFCLKEMVKNMDDGKIDTFCSMFQKRAKILWE